MLESFLNGLMFGLGFVIVLSAFLIILLKFGGRIIKKKMVFPSKIEGWKEKEDV